MGLGIAVLQSLPSGMLCRLWCEVCPFYRGGCRISKSYMQCQWSLVGGMAGTFREME